MGPSSSASRRVLVTDVLHSAGRTIARDLARTGFHVVGTDARPLPFGVRLRCIREFHQIPPLDSPGIFGAVIDTARAARCSIVFPHSTRLVQALCENAPSIPPGLVVVSPPLDGFRAAFDKAR